MLKFRGAHSSKKVKSYAWDKCPHLLSWLTGAFGRLYGGREEAWGLTPWAGPSGERQIYITAHKYLLLVESLLRAVFADANRGQQMLFSEPQYSYSLHTVLFPWSSLFGGTKFSAASEKNRWPAAAAKSPGSQHALARQPIGEAANRRGRPGTCGRQQIRQIKRRSPALALEQSCIPSLASGVGIA